MANRTASFFEGIKGFGIWQGSTCENSRSVQSRFHCHSHTSHYSSALSRVSTVWRHRSFLGNSNAQRLSTHSANRYRVMARGAATRLNRAVRQQRPANQVAAPKCHAPSPHLAARPSAVSVRVSILASPALRASRSRRFTPAAWRSNEGRLQWQGSNPTSVQQTWEWRHGCTF
jgi:hypothetical protein